jgi:hypothetical protein
MPAIPLMHGCATTAAEVTRKIERNRFFIDKIVGCKIKTKSPAQTGLFNIIKL